MIEPITWRDEEGNIMTKATKAKLAKRLHRLEHFLWLFTSCRVQKSHISTTAKLMKSPHVAKNPTMLECFNDMLSTHCRRYKDVRDKLERMYIALDNGKNGGETQEEKPYVYRPLNRDQVERLLTILRDNGIEPDECFTVAEAICFVTDLDTTILEEATP